MNCFLFLSVTKKNFENSVPDATLDCIVYLLWIDFYVYKTLSEFYSIASFVLLSLLTTEMSYKF